jgi:glycosyltransferase involved in cell wall biosynthesis
MIDASIPERMPSGRPWPRITVVTPTFNRGSMLDATIRSVLDQRYPNLEYIVMDGGSTDDTVEIIQRYGDRIAYWESEQDRGQSHALNKGFLRASGELLTWLNSDDKFEPDALFSFALAHDTSGADLIAGMIQILRDGMPDGFHITSAAETSLLLSELLDADGTWNSGKFFYQPEVIFTRDIWIKAGGYVDESLHYSMDYDLWCRMAAAGARLKVIGKSICAFLIHSDQKTLGDAAQRFKSELRSRARSFSKQSGISPRYRLFGSALPRVCLVTDVGFKYGAGIATRRLAAALMSAGHAVQVICLEALPNDSAEQIKHPKISEVIERIRRFGADVVIFGNIHGVGMPPAVVTEVGKHFLTLLLAHDLWWLTGKSTFPLQTRDPLTSEEEDFRDWATYPRTLPGYVRQSRLEKTRVFLSPHAPVVLANSRWTQDVYRRSLQTIGSGTRTIRITLSVPDTFRPHDQIQCRHEFGLPDDKFVIATSVVTLKEERKGVRLLLEAVGLIDDPTIVVAFVGLKLDQPFDEGFQTFCVGPIDEEEKMSRFYSAADVVVSASLMETLGQTLIEASASGVPTIAFAGSGTEDAIKNGVNGMLVSEISVEALADAIRELRTNEPLRREMAFWGPLFVKNEFSIYKSYHSFYRAFEEIGLYTGGEFRRQIIFNQEVKKDVHVETFSHSILVQDHNGMSEELGPHAPLSIGVHRWVREHEASIGLYNGLSGRNAKIIFHLRNFHPDQRLRITYAGILRMDEVVLSNFERKQSCVIDVWVPPGSSRLEFNVTKIKRGNEGSAEAILLEDFRIV